MSVFFFFFLIQIFFPESDFCIIGLLYLHPISKMFCSFLLELNMAKHRHAFLVYWFWKKKKVLNKWKTELALTLASEHSQLKEKKNSKIEIFPKFLAQIDSQVHKH